ncbi:MAG: DNA repair protein RadA [Candidatus Levybacteria bacterium]|nr:DNA repair protein RadA [Candidatus Levybacteria bacterium]
MKLSTSFVCQECGYESPKFLGKCPECGEWNSLREIKIESKALKISGRKESASVKKLSEIKLEEKQRLLTGFSEMDGVLGGGIVKGSVILLAGDPGIGKSTLLLQVSLNLAKKSKILYISGEESEGQIKLRAKRITKETNQADFFLVSETNTDSISSIVQQLEPALIIVDSIQTMESENLSGLSGSVGQVRYAASQFIKIAKNLNIPIIIVGHVTKEGMVAGPMVLSHMVDTVLFLEGEKFTSTRILRSLKNRFGPVDEVGIFAMEEKGLAEVRNPEQYFLGKKDENSPGSVLVATLEGSRPFLVEIQALVVFSKLPMPRRVTSGIDYKRLELLLAVLQKHCRLPLDTMDVFVNVAGGLKLADRAADLGICLAIFSSFKNIPLPKTVGIAEVGLLGELRTVPFLEKRVKEAKKLGFKNIFSSSEKSLLNVLNFISK